MKSKRRETISFHPTNEEIAQINQWLFKEDNLTGEGFYCNWNIINRHYSEGRMATISINKKNVGFVIWTEFESVARIEIIEVKPSYRKRGLGKRLVDELIIRLRENGTCVLDLQCSPATSEPIWRRLGFIDIPGTEENTNNGERFGKELYQILIPHSESTTLVDDEDDVIQLWNKEDYQTELITPNWTWKIEFKKDEQELTKPIIHPCKSDWKIQRKYKNEIVKNKVKYFSKEEIQFRDFLIIKKLPKFFKAN